MRQIPAAIGKKFMMRKPSKQTGFTLIEMMMVVALIAILAAVALPSYNNYVNRSKIKTAQADLIALSLSFENQYQRTLAYPLATDDLSTTQKLKDKFKGWSPASSDFSFQADSTVATGSHYKIVATGTGSSGVSGCKISIDKLGEKKIEDCSFSSSGDWL